MRAWRWLPPSRSRSPGLSAVTRIGLRSRLRRTRSRRTFNPRSPCPPAVALHWTTGRSNQAGLRDQRQHHVQLEVAAGDGKSLIAGVVAHHLRAGHAQRLGNHRVDLPGMIELPGCSAEVRSHQPRRGPGVQPAQVVSIFISATASALSWPDNSTASSWAASPSNLLAQRFESRTRHSGQRLCHRLAEARIGIDAVPSRCHRGQAPQPLQRVVDAPLRRLQLRGPCAEFLRERVRHCIHQVCAAVLVGTDPR